MNTYLYAPKNDLKHRAKWRILYTPEETGYFFLLKTNLLTFNLNRCKS